MSKLALLGGGAVFERPLEWQAFWPPVDELTASKLQDLYFSRQWTAFHEAEGAFAKSFAAHHGTEHGIFMVNGTVTLQCALAACGVGPGDEVIVPALTWYATAMAPHYLGAKPVFVDVEPSTFCIDPARIEAAVTRFTKAIVPVHLYGSMADMDRIMEIARKHRLHVIEDCAHAHGGLWNNQGVGSIGDVGSFSFQHSKTMASAEGGMCVTKSSQLAERIFRMKHIGYGPGQMQGMATSGPPQGLLCHNFRATAFQALILQEQLRSLDERLERYQKAATYLEQRLGETTKIRFQARGRRANRQGYYGWVMVFDHPMYRDIPLTSIQKAISAEGLPLLQAWEPVYRFILFNLNPETYRIDQECLVTEQVQSRMLWLVHAYLGLEQTEIVKIASAIEKVMIHVDELRIRSRESASG